MCVRKRKCDKLYAEGKDETRRGRGMEKGLECQVAYQVQYAKLGCGELMRAVMAMRVSKTNHFALTVDHLIGCYDLKARSERSILGSAV